LVKVGTEGRVAATAVGIRVLPADLVLLGKVTTAAAVGTTVANTKELAVAVLVAAE
jgi:hypothetical protein